MEEYQNENKCLKTILEEILNKQREMSKKKCELNLLGMQLNNTLPIILYCDIEPFKVEGVTTYFDICLKRERFVCFTTFLFQVVNLEDDCVVLKLLKFKNHHKCAQDCNDHKCSPFCQLNNEFVDEIISTSVCIKAKISSFSSIQCLPAVCL
ncbi:CotY/CotZ family spore coat protein [Bacillus massiliigorillae]|uniref:CotY/CotZ family spore coat protein n=1 Tax=Bacillus massiliigorillae TaxID=1243664 RepID=UPI000694D0A1|nr:CotY/CotZ family spore coat protein [Bacillus massiliigorillae]